MQDVDFIKMWMERQGIPLGTERAEFMMRPEGRFSMFMALREEIMKRDVTGYIPAQDLDFRERRRS